MVGTSFLHKSFSSLLTSYPEKRRGVRWKENVRTVVAVSTRRSVDRGQRGHEVFGLRVLRNTIGILGERDHSLLPDPTLPRPAFTGNMNLMWTLLLLLLLGPIVFTPGLPFSRRCTDNPRS